MPSTLLKPSHRRLLKDLVGQRGLVSLLREIRSLSDKDFEAALKEAKVRRPAQKRRPPAKRARLPKDSPVARVAELLKQRGLSDSEAQHWLRSALVRDGVERSRLPPVSDNLSLEKWLGVLFKTVQSAVAYDVARSEN